MDRKQEVRDLMFRTEMARKRRIHPVWTDMGLIAGQPRVLSQLFIKDKITQKELAEACCIEPATLSRALDRLEAMGYIIRNDNPQCRRSFLISLTEAGKKMAVKVKETFEGLEEEMMEAFPMKRWIRSSPWSPEFTIICEMKKKAGAFNVWEH